MRFLALGWVLSSLIFGSPAFAQTPAPTPALGATPQPTLPAAEPYEKGSDYVVSPEKLNVIEKNSSAYHRVGKQFQLTAILFGVGPSVSSTYGLQGSYFLNRNQLIVIELTGGRLGWGSSLSGSNYEVKTGSLGVHFKHFTGNSFYYRVGLDARSADLEYRSSSDFYHFKGTSLAANFQIGNQWQWQSFTLGCDWVGISAPLTSTITDETLSGTAPTYYADWRDNDEDTLVKRAHINLLRFYLGASF